MRSPFLLFVGMALALAATDACGGPPLLLAFAAARNAADTVRQLLDEGYAVDERDGRGLTALMSAARAGATEAMAALLDAGANPNLHDHANGWTALMHAIHKRQSQAARLLLERGADPNGRTASQTPLMMAAIDDDPALVMLLLAHGADARARGFGGHTALSIAVSGGALADIDRPLVGGCRPATVRALLHHDPELTLPDSIAGREARWWAALKGCDEVLRLVDGAPKS